MSSSFGSRAGAGWISSELTLQSHLLFQGIYPGRMTSGIPPSDVEAIAEGLRGQINETSLYLSNCISDPALSPVLLLYSAGHGCCLLLNPGSTGPNTFFCEKHDPAL